MCEGIDTELQPPGPLRFTCGGRSTEGPSGLIEEPRLQHSRTCVLQFDLEDCTIAARQMRVRLPPQPRVLPAVVRPWVPAALRRRLHGSACRMFHTRIPVSPAGGPSLPLVTEVLSCLNLHMLSPLPRQLPCSSWYQRRGGVHQNLKVCSDTITSALPDVGAVFSHHLPGTACHLRCHPLLSRRCLVQQPSVFS